MTCWQHSLNLSQMQTREPLKVSTTLLCRHRMLEIGRRARDWRVGQHNGETGELEDTEALHHLPHWTTGHWAWSGQGGRHQVQYDSLCRVPTGPVLKQGSTESSDRWYGLPRQKDEYCRRTPVGTVETWTIRSGPKRRITIHIWIFAFVFTYLHTYIR